MRYFLPLKKQIDNVSLRASEIADTRRIAVVFAVGMAISAICGAIGGYLACKWSEQLFK